MGLRPFSRRKLYRDGDVILEECVITVGEVEDLEISVGEILGQQPEAWPSSGFDELAL
jgi:hypothetical protein